MYLDVSNKYEMETMITHIKVCCPAIKYGWQYLLLQKRMMHRIGHFVFQGSVRPFLVINLHRLTHHFAHLLQVG